MNKEFQNQTAEFMKIILDVESFTKKMYLYTGCFTISLLNKK